MASHLEPNNDYGDDSSVEYTIFALMQVQNMSGSLLTQVHTVNAIHACLIKLMLVISGYKLTSLSL